MELKGHLGGQIIEGRYRYLSHLLALDACQAEGQVMPVNTPLIVSEWQRELATHPDQEFVSYILRGIEEGFRIGVSAEARQQCRSAGSNMPTQKPEIVKEYLQQEVALGRMIRLDPTQVQGVQISPIGLIPKKTPNKWRLIVDLSSPKGASVNDAINTAWSSLTYATVDHLAALVLEKGRGAMLVKADIKEAYRMGLLAPGGAVGGGHLPGSEASIWVKVGPQNLHGGSRRLAMDTRREGC